MESITQSIRKVARHLLEEGQVQVVIGFEPGSLPLRATPCFIRSSRHVDRLVWNSGCENNLARYLRKRQERVAVVAKGCDTRSIVVLLQERQIDRAQLVIVGVPCAGMVDRRKVTERLGGAELVAAKEQGEHLILQTRNKELVVSREPLLHQSCLTCAYPEPSMYDIRIDAPSRANRGNGWNELAEFESLPLESRWRHLSEQLSQCIRCYACRNACPLCYCSDCFTETTNPQWVNRAPNHADAIIFHLGRALHTAGRCTNCGACQRACPVGLDIRKLVRKVESDVWTQFGYEAGLALEATPPLATFSATDRQDFVLEP